ncbi:MAG: hypothetical protein Q4A27_02005 [bacterium]|nr:hypothetical protein [bacterium]
MIFLKKILGEEVLKSRRAREINPPRKTWNRFFDVEGIFIVELGKITNYSAFIRIYEVDKKSGVFFAQFTVSSISDECQIYSEDGGVSNEVKKYASELIQQVVLRLKNEGF